MTPYEVFYSALQPFLPALYGKVRHDVGRLLAETGYRRPQVLDVGGRKSPYTTGFRSDITVLDVPRESEIQQELGLGLTDGILRELRRRRSNIVEVVLQDMTRCALPSGSFDGVLCVEVIEHIVDDEAFVEQAARVLKPGGWLYMTTPNGDYIPNAPPRYNPDHARHYRREELQALLSRCFADVRVCWGIKAGAHRRRGLASFTPRRPLVTAGAMVSNVVNRWESRGLDDQPRRTAHLFAVARKHA
jgi:SAM-dependent methyltransferase